MYKISEIKEIRKKVGMTQAQLAYESGVSQSLIAKIEANLIDPTYTKAIKIFEALEKISKVKEIPAKDIMNKSIISIGPESNVDSAIKKMKKHEISQMPVIDKKQVVGTVSESALVDMIINNPDADYKNMKINQVMSESPPSVADNTPHIAVSSFLKYFPLVMVNQNGRNIGIITKSDFIRGIYKK